MNKISSIRKLIDYNLSLQWCRENIVVPLSVETNLPPKKQIVKIAIGNFSYLGTIGEFLKSKFAENGYESTFVENREGYPDKNVNVLKEIALRESTEENLKLTVETYVRIQNPKYRAAYSSETIDSYIHDASSNFA